MPDDLAPSGLHKPRRVQSGVATSDVEVSAHIGDNADLFPRILKLHVPDGAKIADVTYGKGVFWRNVPEGLYDLHASDLKTGVDFRALPYADASMDAVVIDPPYMEGLLREKKDTRAGSGTHDQFRDYYSSGAETGGGKWHQAVLDLYIAGGREAHRVLKDHGMFIVKCQDEVCANRQELTHVQLVNAYGAMGFYARDLFVLVRTGRPGVSRLLKQVHARKNHSYFLVFEKVPQGRAVETYKSKPVKPLIER